MNPENKISVSIIIPAFNVSSYIKDCIHSAFAQPHPHLEVICIDNNSTDDTWQKLEQLKQQYPQLIIDKELKPGAPAARNKGLKLSKGEWLQFLDADDLLMPEKIVHQVSMLNETSQVVPFIAASCLKRNLEGKEQKTFLNKEHPFKSLFVTQLGNTCANLWNRNYIERINGWDESLKSSQEADLMFRLLQVKDEVMYDDEPLTIVRERAEGQISQQNHSEKWQRFFHKRIEMLKWLKKYRPEHYMSEKDFYQDALFGILKIMAEKDLKTANRLYKQNLKPYKASSAQTHSTNPYMYIFSFFGFYGAEKIRNLFN
ncbi:glycosyltransferase family A protein [Marinilabilia salmonicolor]|uniref:Glycosyl transferase family 2 n=1 Tax=Marinilabilia salmonicolor TaxID=989 RepID=A0A368UPC7_9BACT|nr:glycosyltransferase family A protein [Marinilabilia salmonicolor]RCW27032.1 glycosyl transferase family 2 [Marinilabilia salmonicolor]